jgi:hypothetical protein
MALRTEKERSIRDEAKVLLKKGVDFDLVAEKLIEKNPNLKMEDVCYCVEVAFGEI